MMENMNLNLNPGIPTSTQGFLQEPEYAAPSSLVQTGEHFGPSEAQVIGGGLGAAAVTQTDDNARFSEMQGGDGDDKSSMTANLETALEEIKHDIVVKSKQVMEEKAWVAQVREIMQQYELKVQRVETNINTLRGDVKSLYKKKRQIENLMLQEKLDSKLNDAKADLATLDNALMHVKNKEKSFEKNKQDVATTVSVIKDQLNKLRGVAPGTPDPDDEGGAEAAPDAPVAAAR